MAAREVTGRDGRRWTITVNRVRWPSWRHSNYDPADDADTVVMGLFFYVLVAPVVWFVVPLLVLVAESLGAASRAAFSSTRWIYAVCTEPSAITIIWRAHRRAAHRLADEIAARLPSGYEDVTPEGAELVYMSEPAGLRDMI